MNDEMDAWAEIEQVEMAEAAYLAWLDEVNEQEKEK